MGTNGESGDLAAAVESVQLERESLEDRHLRVQAVSASRIFAYRLSSLTLNPNAS
jgi:hypothetical protein